jgi:hypothetical protein
MARVMRFSDEEIDRLLALKQQTRSLKGFGPGVAFGPFTFSINPVDLVSGKIEVDIAFFGIPIGSFVLSKNKASISPGINLGFAKCSINLIVDWGDSKMLFQARACIRKFPFGWKCKGYDGTIFSW